VVYGSLGARTLCSGLLFLSAKPFMNKNSFEKSRGVPLNVSVIIDGFNVYHFLKKDKSKKWLNYMELSRKILPNYNIKSVKYFTAQSTWNPKKTHRHNIYLRALQDAGVEVIMGKFQQKTKTDVTGDSKWIVLILISQPLSDSSNSASEYKLRGVPAVPTIRPTHPAKKLH